MARSFNDSPYRRKGRTIRGDRTIDGVQHRRRQTHESDEAAALSLKILNIAAAKGDFRWLMRHPWDPEPYLSLLEALPHDGQTSASTTTEADRRRARSRSPLLSAIIPEFKPIFRRGNSTGTSHHSAQNLDANIEALNKLMGHMTLEEVADLTKSSAAGLLKPQLVKGRSGNVSATVLKKRLSALYQLVSWAREPTGGNYFRGPAVLLEGTWKPATPRKTTLEKHLPHYSVEQLVKLDKACRKPSSSREQQIAFRMTRACIFGGWRWGEIAGFSFDDVSESDVHPEIEGIEVADDYIVVGRAWKRRENAWGSTKPGVAWSAVITPGLRSVIRECHLAHGGAGLLFPDPADPSRPLPYEAFTRHFRAALSAAHLKPKAGYVQKALRHSFVYAAKRAGVSERWVSQHYGHADEDMIRKVYGQRELRRTIPSRVEVRETEQFFGFQEFVEKSTTA